MKGMKPAQMLNTQARLNKLKDTKKNSMKSIDKETGSGRKGVKRPAVRRYPGINIQKFLLKGLEVTSIHA